MMGYKDRAWCSMYLAGECINSNCERAFTAQDRIEATEWWGNEDFPLNIASLFSVTCNYIPKVEE